MKQPKKIHTLFSLEEDEKKLLAGRLGFSDGAPEDGVSEYGVSEYGVSEYGVSENGMSEYGTP